MSKRRLWIVGGIVVWLAGIGTCIGIAFAFPPYKHEAAAAVFALITTGVLGTAAWMINRGRDKDDDGSG
ncbi:MAG TPA: hypothetical protein VL988_02685 [Solirubrobacteraceae bacterium]|nr:hypothetical protein [Solirubrobacteraceae bacterium]